MADNFMDELAAYFQTNSVGTVGLNTNTGWGVYVIHQPGTIDKVVVITPFASVSDPDIPTTNRNFQVMVVAPSTKEALDKAKGVHDLLARKIAVQLTTIYVFSFSVSSMPNYAGQDERERARIVADYTAFARGSHV